MPPAIKKQLRGINALNRTCLDPFVACQPSTAPHSPFPPSSRSDIGGGGGGFGCDGGGSKN
ncbi:hypothetical protein E2C01_095222 [Portunus trituberculatus]|uniref:Uncharacterized protein n=1 Tax=Portunus trituberculatus TaxID=210409 RepID=A0A5B7JYV2_PORTR|nr:hypothetical protein [Portunus trituberculatus]